MIRKNILSGCLSLLISGLVSAQLQKGQIPASKVPIPVQHFQTEYTFDKPSDTAEWLQQEKGLHVSFGTTDELYLRSEVPDIKGQNASWEGTGWRGERMNAQILVWAPDTLSQVRFTLNDLAGSNGKMFSKDNIRLNMVRYVLSNYPYASKDASCGVSVNDTAYLMPDRFEKFDRFMLPGRSVRPVWLSVDIPAGTEPGIYEGKIEVNSEHYAKTLQVKLRVQNQVLPEPHDWKFRLDLWQNPWVVAWYYNVDPWSPEHKALLKKHLKLYADAGGKYITTYAVHSPWSDNSYMIEETMIDWIKKKDGKWKFDYDIFDQYVELAMEVGIDKAITVYTPIPWGFRFRYMDESSGNYVFEEWSPESEKFKSVFNTFLTDLKVHLQKKGWFNKTYLGINENELKYTIAAAKLIKAHSKDWKITYAGDWHPELSGLLDDYSPVISSEPSQKELMQRKSKGFTTTYYVCCTPPQPNNFVFSPPIEGRYISWYSAAYGYDGFLRWAYDAWPEDPIRDARHTIWPAGDCFLVYPGGNSGIRFEKLREGISDYEKIRILREMAAASGNNKAKSSMKEFDAFLTSFIGDPDYSKREYDVSKMTDAVHKGQKMIESLSDELAPRKSAF